MLRDVVMANKTYAVLKLADKGELDEIAVHVIRQDTPDFLLPVRMMEIDGEVELKYEISEGIRMSYLPKQMTKKEFLLLLEKMLRPFQECSDWFLDCHNFYLNKNYITVDKHYTAVKYVYIPAGSYAHTEEDILNFFGDLIIYTKLTDDQAYTLDLYRYLKEKDTTVLSLLEWIISQKPERETVVVNDSISNKEETRNRMVTGLFGQHRGTGTSQPVSGENTAQQRPEEKAEPDVSASVLDDFGKEDTQKKLIDQLFGNDGREKEKPAKKEKKPKKPDKPVSEEKEKKGFLSGILGGRKREEKPEYIPPRPVLPPMEGRDYVPAKAIPPVQPDIEPGENTIIYDDDTPGNTSDGSRLFLELEDGHGYHFPKYMELDMGRGFVTVGRYDKAGNAQADYNFDASLSFISRLHFRVERSGQGYCITDLQSGNGTMLNGETLVANMPYPLNRGDRIILCRKQQITYRVC